jgi:hypothetical protein
MTIKILTKKNFKKKISEIFREIFFKIFFLAIGFPQLIWGMPEADKIFFI